MYLIYMLKNKINDKIYIGKTNNEMKIKSLSYFCNQNGLSSQNMWKVSKGLRNHHKGWKCYGI